MSKVRIIGDKLKNLPWQEKPANCREVMWRYSENPVIHRNPTPSTARVYNSAVVPYEDGFIGVFRADHRDGKARLHVGRSTDALNWEIDDKVIEWKDEKGEAYQPFYSYDPRLVKIEDTYYIMWCTEFGGGPTIGLGKTKNFKELTRLPNSFLPCNRNGVLFPRKINGNFLMLSRPSDTGHTPFGDIFISESPDMIYWGNHRKVMTRGGSGWWQDVKIGAGPIPIETTEGWLLFYHGVTSTCNGFVYSFGAALLDLEDPSKVLYRGKDYLLTPEESYETTGFVPNVAFPCATLYDAETGRIAIYYGAADTYTAVAFAQIEELVDYIKNNSILANGDKDVIR